MIHKPSNLYETRAEALEVIDAICRHQIRIQNAG